MLLIQQQKTICLYSLQKEIALKPLYDELGMQVNIVLKQNVILIIESQTNKQTSKQTNKRYQLIIDHKYDHIWKRNMFRQCLAL